MGILDIFKRKKNEKLAEAVANIHQMFFPGGREEQIRLTNELVEKLGKKYAPNLVANNYAYMLSSLFSGNDKSLETITKKVLNRPNNILNEGDIEIIYHHAIKNNKKLNEMMTMYFIMEEMGKNGTDLDEMPEGKGEFGLDISNPIPVRSIPENEVYLKRLRLSNGESITWRRICSCSADNIPNLIDAYEIYDSKGASVCILHLCPYNRKTSNKAPKGFILA